MSMERKRKREYLFVHVQDRLKKRGERERRKIGKARRRGGGGREKLARECQSEGTKDGSSN